MQNRMALRDSPKGLLLAFPRWRGIFFIHTRSLDGDSVYHCHCTEPWIINQSISFIADNYIHTRLVIEKKKPVTVVPALGDLRRERPPAVYGHVINVIEWRPFNKI